MTEPDQPISLSSFALGYDATEDRLRCRVHWRDGTRDLMLTRRLAASLMTCLARRLERQAQGHATFDHIELTRGGAQDPGRAERKGAPRSRTPDAVRRLDALVLDGRSAGAALRLDDAAGQRYRLVLDRAGAHHLLDALFRRARQADWHLEDQVPWLATAVGAVAADQLSTAHH
jgi:hypothetical protein